MKPSEEILHEAHLKFLEASYEFGHIAVAYGLQVEQVKNDLMVNGIHSMPLAEDQESAITVVHMIAQSGGIRKWSAASRGIEPEGFDLG